MSYLPLAIFRIGRGEAVARLERGAADIEIGGRLRAARIGKGVTLRDAAKHIGITHQQLYKYERGENRVSGPRLISLAALYGISLEGLLGSFKDSLAVNGASEGSVVERIALLVSDLAPNMQLSLLHLVSGLARDAKQQRERARYNSAQGLGGAKK